ncbi:type VI secretion system Vgr family protein [Paracidovorax avenae ATCC 19860]|uniref:Type VI secretion system Vgr family protein n=1 Tax=Paracidovorax avenae (strain ATCC 19860 / DSM 7227 / CCUG 15838 / JCM 20985 / LMG 2117 / NCPPB 1011) TaxID=643561 RepID=F0Q0U9_PARA1|nr:type VI secretion system tip protein VgrG [Paracidovorax avenae]ADX47616.1 type VI secretion system Vgr family protein [Paracidovorax avenae ATCC 19860]
MTQRRVTIQTPLGEALQFRQLQGEEALSALYGFEIDLLSKDKGIDPKALLGLGTTVSIETEGLGRRYLDGIVTRFGMRGQDTSAQIAYRLTLQPWLWLATRRTDFRIFQEMDVPAIVSQVLSRYGRPFVLRLTRGYRSRPYTVQYHESDYQFISRLCESEGIYWFVEHASGSHTVVFADDVVASHAPLPGGHVIPFYPPGKTAIADREHIFAWRMGQGVAPGRAYLDDYDFTKPRADLSEMRQSPPGHAHDAYERYEWPGGYTEFSDGEIYTRLHMEEGMAARERAHAELNKRSIAPGYTIVLENYPRGDQNRQYLVTRVHYHLEENVQATQGTGGAGQTQAGSVQKFSMEVHPTSVPYRPEVTTPRPRTTGPQTAVVVGPPGEEIWTDQYGRVKVQFHWDRIGSMNENSSCWVRVSTSWAGPGFGAVFTPRIGMEVIVDFLNGDPDYPIILGCVYNAANMPPWGLPGNATQSGIKTKSSKGGAFGDGMKNGAGDANAIRFEDRKGAEQLWLHAQKDQLTEVENDEDKWVGQDRRKTIDRDETTIVHRDRTETVDRDEKITVHNNRTERVDHDETISIGDNRREDVGIDETVSIGKNRTKTIGRNEKDKIGNNWSIKVGKMKTETIGIAYMQNVGVGRMENVGVAYNLNVGAVMATVVGSTQTTMVGSDRSVKVGSNQSTDVGTKYTLTVGGGGGGGGGGPSGAGGPKNIVASSPQGGGGGGGGSSITMDAESITLKVGGSTLILQADGTITANGESIKLIGASDVTTNSGGIHEN